MRGDDDSSAGKAFEMGNPPRLTQESGVDPWLVGLLRSTGPYKSPPGRKQRVLLSLGQSNVRCPPLFLRPAIVAGVLIGCGAFASAALGPWRGWIGRAYERFVPSSERIASAPERPRAHWAGAAHGMALVTPPAESPTAPVSIPPSLAPPSTAAAASREPVVPLHVHHAALVSSSSSSPSIEERDTQAVLAGMRALRLDHDPVRARTLLARYLERRPNGALAEEALALTIEAAVAHHDGDAAALGARYLRRYPAGPFRELALRAKR